MTKLILFDIDGTLTHRWRWPPRASRAFADLFDLPDGLNGIPMSGRTDAWIIGEVAARHGCRRPASSNSCARRISVICGPKFRNRAPLSKRDAGILPLLETISSRDDGYSGAVDGNFEQGARIA